MAKANTEALTVTAITPVSKLVINFTENLTASQQTLVKESVENIRSGIEKLITGRLEVGAALKKLSDGLGKEQFSKFCSEIAPKLGVSRRSCYTFLAGYKLAQAEFGEVTRDVLLLTNGGESLVKIDQKDNNKMKLAPGVKEVLSKMPKLPEKASAEQKEQWARGFVQLVGKINRNGGSKSPLDMIKVQTERLMILYSNSASPKGIMQRINELKGATERKTALDWVADILSSMNEDYQKAAKTIHSIPVNVPAPKPTAKPKPQQRASAAA